MNTRKSRFLPVAFGLQLSAFSLFLAGCKLLPSPQADPVRHFTLSTAVGGDAAPDAVSVRPVQLSGHLRSREMAVRVSENEVVYLEDVRWAEPLDEAITQVLRSRLRQVGGGASLSVQVQRCELVRSEGNAVQLTATYSILLPGSAARTGSFISSARTWPGGDHGELVGLLRAAVAEMAEAMATAAGSN